MKPSEKEAALKQLRDVQPHGLNLTEWEEHFLESIDDQLSSDKSISQRQQEILKEIWEKKV